MCCFGQFCRHSDARRALPTTDGRDLILSRYIHPEPDHKILLQPRIACRTPIAHQLRWEAFESQLEYRSCNTDLLITMSIQSAFPGCHPAS
jgi:hypothetical protein